MISASSTSTLSQVVSPDCREHLAVQFRQVQASWLGPFAPEDPSGEWGHNGRRLPIYGPGAAAVHGRLRRIPGPDESRHILTRRDDLRDHDRYAPAHQVRVCLAMDLNGPTSGRESCRASTKPATATRLKSSSAWWWTQSHRTGQAQQAFWNTFY